MKIRILQCSDREAVMTFGRAALAETHLGHMDQEMASWTAPWRAESRDPYLKLGWSFAASEEGEDGMIGVTLAQPLLFFKGQTQTVWVEYLEGDSVDTKCSLVETLYRWARDKHIQALIFNQNTHIEGLGLPWPGRRLDGDWQIATTKGKTS